MKYTTTSVLAVTMLALMATSFIGALILSVVPPYHAVAYFAVAYLGVTLVSIPLSIILGLVAVLRKRWTDFVWSGVLFGFSAGPMAVLTIGGCIFDRL
jgi:hypothetical protein